MTLTTEQVWKDFRGQLRGFLLRRVRDEALADDLLQETFVRVHRGLGTVRDPSRVLPWLSRVARSVMADHFRSAPAGGPLVEEIAERPNPEPVNRAVNHNYELGRCLSGMVERLPDRYRRAFELVEIEGYKQREAAAELDLSLSGAKSRVQRARRMLRESLLECCRIEFDRRGNAIDYERRSGCGEGPAVPLDSVKTLETVKKSASGHPCRSAAPG